GAQLDPGLRSDQWWLFYGDAQGLAERPEDARESYRKGLELNPAHQVLLERFAEISEKLGDWPRAVESWQKLTEAAPDLSQARLRLAQAQRHQGDLANALSSVNRALDIESDSARKAEGFRLKAELLKSLERPQDEIAEAYYEAGRRRYWNNEFD